MAKSTKEDMVIRIKNNLDPTTMHGDAASAVRTLGEMIEYFEAKAEKMREIRQMITNHAGEFLPETWRRVSQDYTDALAHNSRGATSSVTGYLTACAMDQAALYALTEVTS